MYCVCYVLPILNCVTVLVTYRLYVYIHIYLCTYMHTNTHTHIYTHCATSRKVAGSIPGVTGIFHRHNPSGRIMGLGSTQSLAEISTRKMSWEVKATGA